MKTSAAKKISFVCIFLVVMFLAPAAWFVYDINRPFGKEGETVLVDIPRGHSFVKIAKLLRAKGLIRSEIFFYFLSMSKGVVHQIKAGEYEFAQPLSPRDILDKLVKGEIKYYRVVIHEDLNVRQIAERLNQFGLINEKKFLELSENKDFLTSLGIDGDSVEGYLFPDTYLFDRSMGSRQIITRMVGEFQKHITPERVKRAHELGMTTHQWVTMASLIGKETGYSREKGMVSGVFHNRIKKGMRLQSDPTAVYHLKDFTGPILRSHLAADSPYNTYRITGLPPGPIANPGLDSLMAAIYPSSGDFLYFVSKRDGSHFFSFNYSSHLQAIKKYQTSGKKE
ncbi:MAG: endolytic transglycosylase MltG [Syntrophobacterales bacterium]|jgi:UPF0755 protein|nr:endolytic transglycosylase MltG [Syntrophobacterales bacterium]